MFVGAHFFASIQIRMETQTNTFTSTVVALLGRIAILGVVCGCFLLWILNRFRSRKQNSSDDQELVSKKQRQNLFFSAVSKGSITEVQQLLYVNGLEITTDMAKSFNELGETPLLVAIKENDYLMVQFLVEVLNVPINQMGRFLWNEVDYPEVPPLFAAIICDQTFSTFIVHFLTTALLNSGARPVNIFHACLDSILASSISNRTQKIDILELLGAAFIPAGMFRRSGILEFVVECWKKALILRQATPEGEPPIPKIPCNTHFKHGRTLFENNSEFTTLEELLQMTAPVNYNWIVSQALLVINRVVNRITSDPNLYLLLSLYYYDLNFTTPERIDMQMYILQIFETRQWVDVENKEMASIALSSISDIVFCLREIRSNPPIDYPQEEFFRLVMEVLDYASTLLASINGLEKCDAMLHLFGVVSLTTDMFPELSHNQKQQFMRWLFRYFRFIDGSIRKSGGLLGFACFRVNSVEIIQIFLKAGANPNPVYDDGDTLMHKLARRWPYRLDVVKMLLDAGSHNLDVINPKGEMSLDIFKRKQLERDGNPDAFLQTLTKNVLHLQCQCAVVIRRNRIPFDELHPPILFSFVKIHGTDKTTHLHHK